MSYRYERYDERPRRGRGWLVTLVILVWIILLGLLAVRFLARPLVTSFLEGRIAQRVRLPSQSDAPTQGTAVLPADGSTTTTISEADANQWIEGHRQELKGVDSVQLHFVPNEVQADVTIGGVTSTAYAGIQVSNGQVLITNPRLDPPLGLVVDPKPFADLLQQRLNSELAATGKTIVGVTIRQGQIQIGVE